MSIKACRTIAIMLLSFIGVAMDQYAHADTNVGGNITENTTWTVASSPYIVTNTVQVLEGVKLTIEPGVEIRFDPNADLNVGGELNAIGTQGKMIKFTNHQSNVEYAFLRFTSTSVAAEFDTELNYISGCIIKLCKFEITIRFLSEIPLYIDENELKGTRYTTITLDGSDGSVVKNNTFLASDHKSSVAIDVESNSFIQNNTIKYYNSAILASNGNIIKNNLIEDDHGAVTLGKNNIFEYNTITKCGYELDPGSIIVFRGTNTVFRHNTVVGNVVSRNSYPGDFWAIKISGNTSGTIIEYNDIFNNNCKYEIKNQSENNIIAKHNFWGTTDTAAIAEKIYDYYDYIYFGKVIYEPIATQPYFITTIVYVDPAGTCGGNTPCYPTIQTALDTAETGTIIRIFQGSYDEDISFSSSTNLTLSGGWDSNFTSQSGTTSINSMTISNGAVTVDNLVIQ